MEKIINLCPTGTQTTKENSLAPIFYNEIIEEVLACAEIGITLVHLHARDNAGLNTYKLEYYQLIIEGIKKHNPDLVICVSLSGRYFTDRHLRAEVLSLHPDLGSLTMSSMNFPKSASVNDPETIVWLINQMYQYGVHPEIECFDSGMLKYTSYLQKQDILVGPLYINVILGNLFNAGIEASTIADIKNHFPDNAKICLGGIGKAQLKSNVMGLMEADGVRVGVEDNIYYQENVKAKNIDLIKRIHRLSNELGMEIMKSTKLKKLGYGNNENNGGYWDNKS
ncbi:MAG: 3-keto-5-aminohexanoate cleavage protein [Bacteroidota bacterium]|nr:3-keto-5-aminohexanoate cleavage protein [Bacteroidota bacterium]